MSSKDELGICQIKTAVHDLRFFAFLISLGLLLPSMDFSLKEETTN
ncbi:hypothetical protein [Allocoleopsis sp.]